MYCRFVAASLSLFFAICFGTIAFAQNSDRWMNTSDPTPSGNTTVGAGRIIGTVRTFDGHGISNAMVEVRDLDRGGRIVSTRSDSTGSFALYNITPGNYEITAASGVDQTHEQMQVSSLNSETDVDLRLGNKTTAPSDSAKSSTVSVTQFAVPAKARSLYQKAAESMDHGKLDESRKKVDEALAICPKFSEALTLRGVLLGNEGKPDEALADFQQAIRYDPNYPAAYLAMASLLNSRGQFKESTPVLAEAEKLAPNSWQTYFELSRSNLGRRNYTEALHDIDRAVELSGGPQKVMPELHLIRGYALIGLTDIPHASQEIEAYLSRKPNGQVADHARKILAQLQTMPTTAQK